VRGVPVILFRREWSEAFKYSRPLARWLEENVKNFDLVDIHAVFSHACLAAGKAAERSGVPYLVRPIGTLDPWSLKQKCFRKRLAWFLGVKRLLKNSATVLYTSPEEKGRAEESLSLNHGIVIPLGVDKSFFETGEAPGAFQDQHPAGDKNPYVISLSRLHPKKRLDFLIQIFLDSARQAVFHQWKLVIAGDGDPSYVNQLKKMAAQAGADNRIIFPGWLTGDKKIAALRRASLFVSPSYQENFGISIVEAMACGVPVLVSRNVDLASEIKATGAGWTSDLNVEGFSRTLSEALQNEKERKLRGARGRELALSRFTWPKVAREMVRLYNEIIGPGGRAQKLPASKPLQGITHSC